jgi:hypothetical protein
MSNPNPAQTAVDLIRAKREAEELLKKWQKEDEERKKKAPKK